MKQTNVHVGDGASMPLPSPEAEWVMRYGNAQAVEQIRMVVASIAAAYAYLVLDCTKEEAWRRIKLIRAAMDAGSMPPMPGLTRSASSSAMDSTSGESYGDV